MGSRTAQDWMDAIRERVQVARERGLRGTVEDLRTAYITQRDARAEAWNTAAQQAASRRQAPADHNLDV